MIAGSFRSQPQPPAVPIGRFFAPARAESSGACAFVPSSSVTPCERRPEVASSKSRPHAFAISPDVDCFTWTRELFNAGIRAAAGDIASMKTGIRFERARSTTQFVAVSVSPVWSR